MGALTLERGQHILHLQFSAVMEANRRTQKEAPVKRGSLLPVVCNIRFDFPIFLIYPRQAVENLSRNVSFGAPQRRTGQQVEQRTIVEHPKDMLALTKTAPQVRGEHLPYLIFVAHQLDQLIDAILLQQILGTLLLQSQSGIAEGKL